MNPMIVSMINVTVILPSLLFLVNGEQKLTVLGRDILPRPSSSMDPSPKAYPPFRKIRQLSVIFLVHSCFLRFSIFLRSFENKRTRMMGG